MKDKRREKGAQSRKAITNAAIHCIATHGLCNTTLDRVAETAHVSRALVVFHFKSKIGMMTAVIEEISAQYMDDWDRIISEPDLSTEEKLRKLVVYDIRLPLQKPELVAVSHTFWGEAKGLYSDLGYTRDERCVADIKSLITHLVAEGNYEHIDPDLVCSGLVAMLFGLWWKAHLDLAPDHFEHSMRVVESWLSTIFPNHFEHP